MKFEINSLALFEYIILQEHLLMALVYIINMIWSSI